jgi:hypothetical protein
VNHLDPRNPNIVKSLLLPNLKSQKRTRQFPYQIFLLLRSPLLTPLQIPRIQMILQGVQGYGVGAGTWERGGLGEGVGSLRE